MGRRVEVLVIGAGPGGYPAAIRSAQLGRDTLLVERRFIGGECLHWGCIPSKALLSAADLYHKITHSAPIMGINVGEAAIDARKLQEWKSSVLKRLVDGIVRLLRGNGVDLLMGSARFTGPHTVEVSLDGGGIEAVEAEDIIIAVGAEFQPPEGIEVDEKRILSPRGALELDSIPEDLICIGGEFHGLELATIFAKLGSRVSVIEKGPRILQSVDPSLVDVVERNLKNLHATLHVGSKVKNVEIREDGRVEVEIEKSVEGPVKLTAERALVSMGKRPLRGELGLDETGIRTDGAGFIVVDPSQRTNVPHLYAVGDCTGPPFMAHRATKQGIVAAEVIAGRKSEADFRAMPRVIFTDPQIALAGMTEGEAKGRGFDVVTGIASFGSSGRAMTLLEAEGFVKAVVDRKTGAVLGVQMVGPNASDLISEVALALEMGAVDEDFAFTVHPHPTLPETIMEAVRAAQGTAINVLSRAKRV